jgi:pimeloyl-ACP methyl ester carboxylesterase
MKSASRFSKKIHVIGLVSMILAGTLGTTISAAAQDFDDLQSSKSPLVLKTWGSFFVGGETVEQTSIAMGLDALGGSDSGNLAINQMYVQYMIPRRAKKVPVVMVHGGTLSGKGYETQPDGRMGWAEYFVRRSHAVYLPDQVSRARSGFNQAVYNNVRAGIDSPASQPSILRLSNEAAWTLFRFGPSFGVPHPDEQFPVESVDEFAKQGIPDLNSTLPSPNLTPNALSDLAIKLKGAVLMGHSESGLFPLEAALIDSTGTKGLIVMEPAGCNATVYTDQQIATLATLPILVVFGDHLDTPTGLPGFSWQSFFDDCQAFIGRVNDAGGNAQMLYPPDLGIFGNSHMIMNDKNSNQIADLILEWIDQNVGSKKTGKKSASK